MNIIDSITEPVKIKSSAIAGVSGELVKPDSSQGSGQPESPVSPAIAGIPDPEKPGLEFKPVDEKIIPPLENVNPPVPEEKPIPAEIPPISEDNIAGDIPLHDVETGMPENPPQAEVKRGRGRPPGSKTVRPPSLTQDLADPEKQLDVAAAVTFDLSAGLASNIFSPAWQPRNKEERDFMVGAIAAYYRETGVVDIPPKTALILAIAVYSLPRFAEPTTKEKLKLWFAWVKMKIGGFFKRK
jgi:hypothetical protein